MLVVACLLLVSACASIPLSTALRFSSFDEKALHQLDPAAVRVKVSVPRGNEVDIGGTRLKLELQSEGEPLNVADMPLRLLGTTEGKRSAGMFSADIPVTTYELALAPEGAHRLRELQRQMLHGTGPVRFEFSVNTKFSKMVPGLQEMTFWVDLKLRSTDAYMPLLDGAKVKFKQ
ncbi:MAG: hypothetical protein ACREP4_03240 [Stenotrophomonas sp.]|uniref:hypothetical protein n=1 Tax=Stenotrophomonas sp. TaxID=69392 RepID=UPI003D6DA591